MSIDGILLTTTLPAILRRPDGSAAENTRPRKSVPARVALDDHIFGMIAEALRILDFHRINDRTTSFYTSIPIAYVAAEIEGRLASRDNADGGEHPIGGHHLFVRACRFESQKPPDADPLRPMAEKGAIQIGSRSAESLTFCF